MRRSYAVDTPMLDELSARLADAAKDSVRAVLLTGAGRAFCSGGDLTGGDTDGAAQAANRVVQAITALPKDSWRSSPPEISRRALVPSGNDGAPNFAANEQGSDMRVKTVRVDGLDIEYTDTGTGPTILFVHGVYVAGALWNDVVTELGDGFRCVVPTWPLGAHRTPTTGADLGVEAASQRIVHFIEALDLTAVTIVANDTGGGLVLATLGDPTPDVSRIARLVLTNCDSYEHFPPGSFAQIVKLCRASSAVGGGIMRLLASSAGQTFFLKQVCQTPPTKDRRREVFGAFATSPVARRDAVTLTASLDPAITMRAAPAIEAFDKPVTLVWGTDDALFPLDHAHRLRDAFPSATLIEIPDCSAFVMLDAPQKLAEAIRGS